MPARYLLRTTWLLAALCGGCGGGGGDNPPPSPPPDDIGAGWLSISSPTSQQTTTDEVAILVAGGTFISPSCAGNGCGGPGASTPVLTGVAVTWANSTTGETGTADQRIGVCPIFGFVCEHLWNTPVSLAIGTNNIRIRAADASGNVGSEFITVQRNVDITPPTVTAVSPQNQAQGVAVDTNLTARFSERMDPATINGISFQLFDSNNNPVAGTVTYAGNTATFDPTNVLAVSSSYTARITTAAKDFAGGNPIVSDFSWTFSTN